MLTVVMILTFRTKAIIAVLVLYMFYLYFVKFNFRSLLPVGVGAVGGAVYFGYDSLYKYYIRNDTAARKILTEDSVNIANKYFPLGSGFGSFGSNIAAQYYSKLYLRLGY